MSSKRTIRLIRILVCSRMAAPNFAANAAYMLNMPVSIFLFVEFCSAFQKARTFTPGDALLQWLL